MSGKTNRGSRRRSTAGGDENILPFQPPKRLRQYRRHKQQQNADERLDIRVTPAVKRNVCKVATRFGTKPSTLLKGVAWQIACAEDAAEDWRRKHPDHPGGGSRNGVTMRLEIFTGGRWETIGTTELPSPENIILREFSNRIQKCFEPFEWYQFMDARHPDLGMTPREAVQIGRERDVDRLIRRIEREVKAARAARS